jgi:hypothetical protein
MAARVVDKLPEGDEWLYEVKFDGYASILTSDLNFPPRDASSSTSASCCRAL